MAVLIFSSPAVLLVWQPSLIFGFASKYIVKVAFVLAISIQVLLSIAFAAAPIRVPEYIGSLGILILFISQLTLFLILAAAKPKIGGSVLVAILVLAIVSPPLNHDLEVLRVSRPDRLAAYDAFRAWVRKRGDLEAYKKAKRPYPVILVASEGGGLYAAAHAYFTLSMMQSVCPSFAQHAFAAVGVSGGSFGNLLFSSSLPNDMRNEPLKPCAPAARKVNFRPVAADHLSPVLGRMLFLDLTRAVVPWPFDTADRAKILAESFADASGNPSAFQRPLRESWSPMAVGPMNIFVTTSIKNGQRFIFSPVAFEKYAAWFPSAAVYSEQDIRQIDAATTSARFPWITPAAHLQFEGQPKKNNENILVDGGYFENSGVETVVDMMDHLNDSLMDLMEYRKSGQDENGVTSCLVTIAKQFIENVEWTGCDIPVAFIVVSMTTETGEQIAFDTERAENAKPSSFLLDPIKAMLRTREGRGRLAVERARLSICGSVCVTHVNMGFFENQLPYKDLQLPLGWYLSTEKLTSILNESFPIERCAELKEKELRLASERRELMSSADDAPKMDSILGDEPDKSGFGACRAAAFAYLFNPEFNESAYGIFGLDP